MSCVLLADYIFSFGNVVNSTALPSPVLVANRRRSRAQSQRASFHTRVQFFHNKRDTLFVSWLKFKKESRAGAYANVTADNMSVV